MELFILLSCFAAMLALGVIESRAHARRLRRIPTRIHVAGTRGKSSVTRLVAGALREAGLRTVAKTTGTLARMILPDGREVAVFRPIGPNIMEQLRIVQAAARLEAQVLVVECMALKPALHWLSERKMIRATHGVITNARADHLEVMGPDERGVARCLAGMTPVGGVMYTCEEANLDVLLDAARDRRSEVIAVSREEIDAVGEEDLSGFGHVEHPDNVALALKVVKALGVERDVALRGMWKAGSDPGALTEHVLEFFGRRIIFVNGFAANDPTSTESIWRMFTSKYPAVGTRVALFNLRADRPHRTVQLARDALFWREADRVVVMGSGAYSFGRLVGAEFDDGRLIMADEKRPEDIFEHILQACGPDSLVVGMGNIASPGLELVRFFENRALIKGETPDV